MSEANSKPEYHRNWALFLDVDGTLIEFAETPGDVRIPAQLAATLAALQTRIDGAVALISGRPIAELDQLFAPLKLLCAGLHGCERRDSSGRIHRPAPKFQARLGEEISTLHSFATDNPGVIIEDKGLSVAIHYRLAPSAQAKVRDLIATLQQDLGEDFVVQNGNMVVEIKPSGRDKGIAIDEFLRELPFSGRRAVYIGDDLTDEMGFDMVNQHAGHSIKVGPGRSSARWRLENPACVRQWLAAYADFLGN